MHIYIIHETITKFLVLRIPLKITKKMLKPRNILRQFTEYVPVIFKNLNFLLSVKKKTS